MNSNVERTTYSQQLPAAMSISEGGIILQPEYREWMACHNARRFAFKLDADGIHFGCKKCLDVLVMEEEALDRSIEQQREYVKARACSRCEI